MNSFTARPELSRAHWNLPTHVSLRVAAILVSCLAHLYATEYEGSVILFGRN